MKTFFLEKHTALGVLIVLTLVYIGINEVTGGIGMGANDNLIGSTIGLFVPAGVWVSVYSMGIAPLLTLGIAVFLDRFFVKRGTTLSKKVAIILPLFFLLSLAFDYILFDEFVSLNTFLNNI